MDKLGAEKIIASMLAAYSNYRPTDVDYAAKTWEDMLEEYTYEQVSMGLKIYIKTDKSGFPPAPGQVIDKIHSITQPEQLNEMEAWALVAKALRNGGYHALEEYEKLPPTVQKAVGTHEQLRNWALDEYFNEENAKKNFIFAYRTEVKREQELDKMPRDVRRLIESVNQNSHKAQIEGKRQEAIKSLNERKESEIRALGDKREGVPMPKRCKQRMEELRNEIISRNNS